MANKKRTCFVAMPITTPVAATTLYGNDSDHFLHVLEHLFTPAIERSGYHAIKPKHMIKFKAPSAGLIRAAIIRHLQEADLVLCDITTYNPNVFFELGIRTVLNRPVVLVKDDKTVKIPFNTSTMNIYVYESELNPWTLESQICGISEYIQATVGRANGRNAMWPYFGSKPPGLNYIPVENAS